MASGILSAELAAACNSLGFRVENKYITDTYCTETIIDLIRYLRRDEEDHGIRRYLGNAKILQTDLLPILIGYGNNEKLFDVVLRLLLILTTPVMMIYQEQLPAERIKHHDYLEILSQLQTYKEAFTNKEVWKILWSKLHTLLNIPTNDREDDQTKTIERILVLTRNVLLVPADAEEKRPDNDASIHDQVLWSLQQSGMMDLILFIACTSGEQQFYLHVLEIISQVFREQTPDRLASASHEKTLKEKERDEKELLELRRKEKLEKDSKAKKYAGSRHSKFGGTFVVEGVKSIGDKDLITHKSLATAIESPILEKERAKVPKNKVSMTDHSAERRSPLYLRFILKDFCIQFLHGAYNPLMHEVRRDLVRGSGQDHDETYYFWAISFFMGFNRIYNLQEKLVSETMHQEIFHFVQSRMDSWLESMIVDKKQNLKWSRRIHTGLRAYKELLVTLELMESSPDMSVQRSATVVKRNVFYNSEHREQVITFFNLYSEIKFPRSFLKDLVETTHILLKMLEKFCKTNHTLVVQGKLRKKPSTKKTVSKSQPLAQDLDAAWEKVTPVLTGVIAQGCPMASGSVLYDPVCELSMDEQKIKAMRKIKAELMEGNVELALALLKEARTIWPENNSFGKANMNPDEEFLLVKDIFYAEIEKAPEEEVTDVVHIEEEEKGPSDEEDSDDDVEVPETVFKFNDFFGRFVCSKVLSSYCLLLESFETNSEYTNYCITKMFHRVAHDCKIPSMLFQASLFKTFQKIFKSGNPKLKKMALIASHIIRSFCKVKKQNKKIFLEILFWKTKQEAYEIEHGYGTSEPKSHSSKNVWEEEHENELRKLATEYDQTAPDEPDAVAWIMKNMINQSRSRKAVIKKLKELCLFVGNMKPKPKKPKEMASEEVEELTSLYHEFKGDQDVMNCILGRLSVPRSRRLVVNKLCELGLVTDKKELRKKKKKKENMKETNWGERSDDESIYDSWSDDDDGLSAPKVQRKIDINQIQCIMMRAVETGEELKEPLEWLRQELQDALNDLPDKEDGDNEGTALMPLSLPCIQAVESDPLFQRVLDIFSIEKPTDQKMFWRIPAHWNANDLEERISWINNCMDRVATSSSEELTQLSSNYSNGDMILPGPSSYEEVEEEENMRKRKRLRVFDSESESETDIEQDSPTQKSIHGLKQKKGRMSSELTDTHADHTSNRLADDTALLSQEDIISLSGSSKATLSQKTIILSSQESTSDNDVIEVPAESKESFFNKNSLTTESNQITLSDSDSSDYSQNKSNINLQNGSFVVNKKRRLRVSDSESESETDFKQNCPSQKSIHGLKQKKGRISSELTDAHADHTSNRLADDIDNHRQDSSFVVNKNKRQRLSVSESENETDNEENSPTQTILLSSQGSSDEDVIEIPAPTQDNYTCNGSFDSNSTSSQETISPPFDEVNLSNYYRQESPKSNHGLRKKKQRSSSESDDIVILSPPKRFSSNGIIENTPASSQEICSDDLENTPALTQESCSDDLENTPALSQESCSDDLENTPVSLQESCSDDIENTPASSQETCSDDLENTPALSQESCSDDTENTPASSQETCSDDLENTPALSQESCSDDLENTPALSQESCSDDLENTSVSSQESCSDDIENTPASSQETCSDDLENTPALSQESCSDDLENTPVPISVNGSESDVTVVLSPRREESPEY